MASLTYHEQKDIENIKKLRGLIKELPPFCADFFRGIEPLTSTRTRIAYAYDLRIFFDFLKTSNSQVARMGENIRLSVHFRSPSPFTIYYSITETPFCEPLNARLQPTQERSYAGPC